MIKSILKFGIRSLLRQRLYTAINVIGLTVGLFSFMMIMLYVRHEESFDQFHEKKDQIYRLISHAKARSAAVTPYVWGKFLKEEISEIEEIVAVNPYVLTVRKGAQVFSENAIFSVDSTFFKVFQFPVITGNRDQLLHDPNKIVITPELATRYFGNENPVGQLLEIDMFGDFMPFEIEGVVECPENSHLQFTLLMPRHHFLTKNPNPTAFEHWRIHFLYNYLLMPGEVDAEKLRGDFSAFLERHAGKEVREAYQPDIVPLKDIYLRSDLPFDLTPKGSDANNRILTLVAFGILLMAAINFVNISSAQSLKRAKEVGVRKVFGSQKQTLVFQFVVESVMVALIATILAFFTAVALLPSYNLLVEKNFAVENLLSMENVLRMAVISILVGVVSGTYPALIMSSFKPILVLRSRGAGKAKGAKARKVLVIFQFALAVVLILSTGVIYKQVNFMGDKSLGFNKEQAVAINGVGKVAGSAQRTQLLRTELLKNQQISSVSASSIDLGQQTNAMRFTPTGFEGVERPSISTIFSDHDYAQTYDLELVEGRFFDRSIPTDSGALVVNEAALRLFSTRDPEWLTNKESKSVGWTSFAGHTGESKVIGVVKDFNFESLKSEIKPLVFKMEPQFFYTVQLKIETANISETLDFIESTWKRLFPDVPYAYNFVDEQFALHFQQDEQLGSLLSIFAILSILIAVLGLFGLASFLAIEKEKEMSIRKVVGASEMEILKKLSWIFLKLSLVSNLIALPAGYLLMNSWLDGFAFRIDAPIVIFIGATGISLLVTVLTVGYHAFKTATLSPARVLAQEG